MGMYETLNGEQVKCFSWTSFSRGGIVYHDGHCKYYNTGDEVPYKKPHYNYGKNFVILDLNEFLDCDYDYILHVIVDGKLKDTFENELGDIDWSIVENVVTYHGELINVKSPRELINYIKARKEYLTKYNKVNSRWHELFDEIMPYYSGLGLLEDGSTEKKFRLQKIEEIHKLMAKERDRILPKIHALDKSISKWFVDTSKIYDLIELGAYIEAYHIELRATKEEAKTCREIIMEMLSSDDTLCDRYVEWQGSDEYIKEFKE